jgi:hypothetical protein
VTWIKYDAYHETHLYVDAKGRIVGEVRGSVYEKDRGFYAFDETTVPPTHLGRYISADDGKSAVMERLKKV